VSIPKANGKLCTDHIVDSTSAALSPLLLIHKETQAILIRAFNNFFTQMEASIADLPLVSSLTKSYFRSLLLDNSIRTNVYALDKRMIECNFAAVRKAWIQEKEQEELIGRRVNMK